MPEPEKVPELATTRNLAEVICQRLRNDPALAAMVEAERIAADEELCADCHDCGLPYGDPGFPDLLLPNDAWKRISPDGEGNGLLCPNCICRRLHFSGIKTTARFVSGPLAEPQPATRAEGETT